ncbi:Cnm67p Ecym_6476 [Eremothecium cymbalariae DBVPG|uniref:Uncharacterized protein n=1 Tax=Eremothecium cymbalariae (strain CBS 270.75 / DBVPG 7215 / KCTC 17166 / NRRL Y-17582) TaxID=931890 RepID=G8JUR7_ERECY|nr:hypothetical protein Ecym_6476 [Eremothecium cymbalariae DBVPG\
MFAVGNGFDEIRSSRSIPLSVSEEKFDYTESEFDENDDSAVSEGNIRLDRSFNFRGFMDRLTGKQKALELAHQLDLKRGVSSGLDNIVSPDAPSEQHVNDENGHPQPIRRVPSGARQGHTVRTANVETSTPTKHQAQGKGNDLLVQSTPLTKAATVTRPQPKDLLREKLIENHNRKVSTGSIGSGHAQRDMVQETKDLREENSRLQEELENLENRQLEKDGEISQLNRTLNEKDMQISELRKHLESKKTDIIHLEQKSARTMESLKTLEDELKQRENRIKSLEQSIESATVDSEAEVIKLNKELEQVTLEYKKYKIEAKLRLDETESLLVKSNDLNQELQESVKGKTDELTQLSKKLVTKENEVSDLNSSLTKSNTIISKLQTENDSLSGEVRSEKEKLAESEKEVEVLKKSLDELQDKKDTEINALQNDIDTNWKQKQILLDESMQKCQELKVCLSKKENELNGALSQNKRLNSEKDSFKKFVELCKCYDVPIGLQIVELFKKSPRNNRLNPAILKERYEIVGFKLTSDEELLNNIKSELEPLKALNLKLKEELESKLKDTKDHYVTKESNMKENIKELQEDVKVHLANIKKSQDVIESLHKDIAALIKEKEELLNKNAELSKRISELQESQLQRDRSTFLDLCEKNQDLLQSNHELITKSRDLEAELVAANSNYQELESKISEKDSLLKDKQQTISDLQLNLNQLRKNLEKLKGNPAEMISFESAQKIYQNLDRKTYNNLMVEQVNQLDLVELQNVVKNVILLLETPFSKLSKKMPLVSIYLRYEKSLCFHFANKLHYHVYQEPIDIKKFTNKAYSQYLERHDLTKIKHPLEFCLDKLYEEVRSRLKY